jgi:hypothetical protein
MTCQEAHQQLVVDVQRGSHGIRMAQRQPEMGRGSDHARNRGSRRLTKSPGAPRRGDSVIRDGER